MPLAHTDLSITSALRWTRRRERKVAPVYGKVNGKVSQRVITLMRQQ